MVQKKQEVLVEMTDDKIAECLSKLTESAKPNWGILTAQHLLEHLEQVLLIIMDKQIIMAL